ncbi:MAG: hypothetical protein EOO53_18705 [Gammaproteobacteria bacterium]|nr:MAG: hypothetical protein EOO53_18705 [Gammaproteobacteria bacterium]
MKISLFLLATTMLTLAVSASADLIPRKEMAISNAEFSKLESIGCLTPHKLSAEEIRGYVSEHSELKSGAESAYVKCKSHGIFMETPIYYQTYCWIDNGQWKCNETELEGTIKIGQRNVKVHPLGISLETTYKTLTLIRSYGNFQGIPMMDAIGSSCDVSQLDNEIIELSCRKKITVSSWCPQPQLTGCPRVISVAQQPSF